MLDKLKRSFVRTKHFKIISNIFNVVVNFE